MKLFAGCVGRPLPGCAILWPVVAMLLGGCSGKQMDVPDSWLAIIEAEAATPPTPPAECATARDPKWKRPPEGPELAADTARREQANRNAFNDLAGRRRVCVAGLVTQQQEGK